MSVHHAISEHSRRQNQQIEAFLQLDRKREQSIEEALDLCRRGEPFSVAEINRITAEINERAKKGIIPTRRMVTEQMIRDFAAAPGKP
ncbi:YpbS family protein [Paenibacillus sp. CC-CFT747]|nr:YpbS family protein [Paenibacillus sp. CC-CFT747]